MFTKVQPRLDDYAALSERERAIVPRRLGSLSYTELSLLLCNAKAAGSLNRARLRDRRLDFIIFGRLNAPFVIVVAASAGVGAIIGSAELP